MLASLGFASIVCGFRVAVCLGCNVCIQPPPAPHPPCQIPALVWNRCAWTNLANEMVRKGRVHVWDLNLRHVAVRTTFCGYRASRSGMIFGWFESRRTKMASQALFLSSSCSLASDTALRLAGSCDSHGSLRRLACPVGDLRFNLPQQRHSADTRRGDQRESRLFRQSRRSRRFRSNSYDCGDRKQATVPTQVAQRSRASLSAGESRELPFDS